MTRDEGQEQLGQGPVASAAMVAYWMARGDRYGQLQIQLAHLKNVPQRGLTKADRQVMRRLTGEIHTLEEGGPKK